ncbi:folliculin-interacting protein 2 isoform X2 [Onthophagus taurus]|uniref:folliculin-interacting protein 2 isoform X2 n=1 Tax=Onthophagus taurus TaxID=166361 RepID=UPI0039BE8100
MALLNRLFLSRKRTYKHQDNVREKLFHFNNEQVRVVLFRECDFRGRKLLFDSQAVDKVPLGPQQNGYTTQTISLTDEEKKAKFAEISNGHGYSYAKPHSDVQQLGEMIFGSVAMSYRGTSYKIHSLNSPASIMCTQVFPCPRPSHTVKNLRNSAPGRTCIENGTASLHNLDHSIRLEDSSTSCTTSFSDQSVHSTASDTLLVCRRTRSSPLDVPNLGCTAGSTIPNTSLIGDSGFCGAQSFEGPKSVPMWSLPKNDTVSFSCGSLYRRWLRSTSTSLEYSGTSLTGSGSIEDCYTKSYPRPKKLGLAIIIQYGQNQQDNLEKYLLEHSVLIEAMVWRLRHSAEIAYIRHTHFLSIMLDVTASTCSWLTSFLSGPQLSSHAWQALSSACDNSFSINDDSFKVSESSSASQESLDSIKTNDFVFLNLSRFFTGGDSKRTSECNKRNDVAQKFIKELCELLESLDIKNTNFFISTLITAVLTHHLGWVATAWRSTESDKEVFKKLEQTGNPLWGQLNDLYGAVGHPTKMAHTVITGSNNSEIITKILSSLTYFIRCNDVLRQCATRENIEEENETVDEICKEKNCIPKENFKKYEDHLKEIAIEDGTFNKNSNQTKLELIFPKRRKNSTKPESNPEIDRLNPLLDFKKEKPMIKSTSCLTDLSKMCSDFDNNNLFPERNSFQTLKKIPSISEFNNESTKINTPPQDIPPEIINFNNKNDENDVVFILGDDDKLVGLKKDIKSRKTSRENIQDEENDKASIKPSTSWNHLNGAISKQNRSTSRAKSEPPEDIKPNDHTTQPRYSVKFNFKQHQQIFTNYMKSKNIELSNLRFSEKVTTYNGELSSNFDFSTYRDDDDTVEALQTPSNASELEFISEIQDFDKVEVQSAKESYEERKPKKFIRQKLTNTVINEPILRYCGGGSRKESREDEYFDFMNIIELPLPRSIITKSFITIGYTSSLFRGISDKYTSDMVLQGISSPKNNWETTLRKDLSLAVRHPLLDQPIEEAVAIIANTDSWEVQLMSSHTYVIDKGTSGVRIGMSQLVANMLEQLLQMWKLQAPAEHCLMHIEERLQEVCLRSKALAEMLLETDFCSIELLTSTLQLEVNDIPLLMAVASTHSPQITQKYGLSFQ